MAADLSSDDARRIAVAAQGLTRPRPSGPIDRRHLRRVLGDVGVIQLDSVNVAVRAHYMPAYSRLGPYDRDRLDRLANHHHETYEYWAHEASLVPIDLHPLLRWRMAAAANGDLWAGIDRFRKQHRRYIDDVLAEVRDKGPLTAADLDDPGTKRGPWWGYSNGKRALEWLFWTGAVTATRYGNFQRRYALPERVIPRAVLAAPTPSVEEAQRELLSIAGAAMGIATARDLADYFRIQTPKCRPRIAELVEEGVLEELIVEGWSQPTYRHRDAVLPRRAGATTLLSPFDSLIWNRDRTERLFDFIYRIEIYTPKSKRVYGYYVYPFLFDGHLVARVDLKADRESSRLLAQKITIEPTAPPDIRPALDAELDQFAAWLGLDGVVV